MVFAIVAFVGVEQARAQTGTPKFIDYFTSTNWWGGATFADYTSISSLRFYSAPQNYSDVYPAYPGFLLMADARLVASYGGGTLSTQGTSYYFPDYDYLVTEIYEWDGENLTYFKETWYDGKSTGVAVLWGPKYAEFGPNVVDIQGYHTFESTSITRN